MGAIIYRLADRKPAFERQCESRKIDDRPIEPGKDSDGLVVPALVNPDRNGLLGACEVVGIEISR